MQQPQFLFPVNKWYRTGSVDENIQSALFSLQQDISFVFSMNSWSNWTSNDSFEICSSWGFPNNPYMFDLMKFWLSYLRLKRQLKINWDIQGWRHSSISKVSVKSWRGVSESSWWAYFKTVIGCPIWPRIHGENIGNVVLQTEQRRLYISSN